ncbi:MAG: ABC transporter ATP-binding protein [Pseudomonadota bacterium]
MTVAALPDHGQRIDAPALSVRNLVVEIPTRRGILKPVDGVSFDIAPGEILGLVGESGAGKSMTGSAVIGLIERPGRISGGEIWLGDSELTGLTRARMRDVRGQQIGMIFQDPMASLNPLKRVGDMLVETIQLHLGLSNENARARALQLLNDVGIPAAENRMDGYPHEFSGGMRQRVVIALALAGEPELIIADEPTTALDVSVQAQIMALLKRLCRERGVSILLITHDMGVIAEAANRIAVLYAGRLVEIGGVRETFEAPLHPYTRGLMQSTPSAVASGGELRQIPGAMPGLAAIPTGCAFHPRCPKRLPICDARRPNLAGISKNESAGGPEAWPGRPTSTDTGPLMDRAVACWLHAGDEKEV